MFQILDPQMPSPLGSIFHSPINCSFLCTLMMLHILFITPFFSLFKFFIWLSTLKAIQESRNYLINLHIIHCLSKTPFLQLVCKNLGLVKKGSPNLFIVLMPTSDAPGSLDKNIICIIHIMISLTAKK